MEILNEVPTYGTEAESHSGVIVAKFGDGYEQRAKDGLNSDRLKLSVEFSNVTKAKAVRVVAFLQAHGGHTAFLWTAPAPYDDQQRQWIMRPPYLHTWDGYDNHTVRAIFEEDFTVGLT